MKLGIMALLSLVLASIPRRDPYKCVEEITDYFIECYGDTFNNEYHIELDMDGVVYIRALLCRGSRNSRMMGCMARHNLNYLMYLAAGPWDPDGWMDSDTEDWSSESIEKVPWEIMLQAHPNLLLVMACSELEALPTLAPHICMNCGFEGGSKANQQ